MIRVVDSRAFGLMATLVLGFCVTNNAMAGVVDFENLIPDTPYTGLGGGEYWNGSDGIGGFVSGGVSFANNYNKDWNSWDGWSYSNTSDVVTKVITNQYSAFTGKDHTEPLGVNYGVYYEPWSVDGKVLPSVTLASGSRVLGAWVTNTTYAALSMLNGDSFGKKFGGLTGDDQDWFLLSISGTNSQGKENHVHFYLADYRFADNASDYVVNRWERVDLTSLGDARELTFSLTSSDTGDFGMNTPAYFAMDDLILDEAPEPGTLATFSVGALLGSAFLWRRKRAARAK